MVPLAQRYYEALRLLAALLAALRFLRLAIPPGAPVFVSSASPTPAWDLEFSGLATPSQLTSGDDRASQVPGEPLCAYALFSDPGRTGRLRPLRGAGAASVREMTKAPALR